ncbi:MAG: SAM-dependent methyltransferase [Burkholderiales bacterium]
MRYTPEFFDTLFSGNDDPWNHRACWYEARKRALVLASLPAARYQHAYEPGCANGELSAALAGRCDRLWVSDGSPRAVAVTRARLAAWPHVQVQQAWLPAQWPDALFDLVVISELGYYLDPSALDELAAKVLDSLQAGATVLACHWRWPIENCALSGDAVHQRLGAALNLPLLGQVLEADLRIDVWCQDSRSVGQHAHLA